MNNRTAPTSSFRLAFPEVILLEPEDFARASHLSQTMDDADQQWQMYLHTLAQQGVTNWLLERAPDLELAFAQDNSAAPNSLLHCTLQTHPFTLGIIATDQVFDGFIPIPLALTNPPAHHYICVEVLPEQEEIRILGILRGDQCLPFWEPSSPATEGTVPVPLERLDPEPDRLLHYYRWTAPAFQTAVVAFPDRTAVTSAVTTKLKDWLAGSVCEGWQGLTALIHSDADLSWSTRSPLESDHSRVKLIDLGHGLPTVALLMSVIPEPEEKLQISVQLHPTGLQMTLPTAITLHLYSRTGKVLQTVQANEQDNLIQLRPFRVPPLTTFSLRVAWSDCSLSETFEA